MPIQLKYLVSFFAMYVFPRAGSPTITMTHGAIAMFEMSRHCATNTQINQGQSYNSLNRSLFSLANSTVNMTLPAFVDNAMLQRRCF